MNILSNFAINEEVKTILFNMVLGLIAGIIIAAGYIFANKERKFSKNFVITILILPIIMTIVIPFIASDLKKTLSLAGIFALVRFRSIPGDSKDILFVFFSIASGLILGLNSYFIGFMMVILITILFVLISRLWNVKEKQVLKITIPEDMNYQDVFNDIFDKYLVKYGVKNVKTSNMGTLFTISYWIQAKNDINVKAFIDELRTRNGNLNIIIENSDDAQAPVL
ncbi:MAG: DUF4956 domain-containing protein [Treponema sp.]|nr:DUF4956 domain-containing protein [Treponema sp.]